MSSNGSEIHGYDEEGHPVRAAQVVEGADDQDLADPGPATRNQRKLAGKPLPDKQIPLPTRKRSTKKKSSELEGIKEELESDEEGDVFSPTSRQSLEWDTENEPTPLFNSSEYSVPRFDHTFDLTGISSLPKTPNLPPGGIDQFNPPASPEFEDALEDNLDTVHAGNPVQAVEEVVEQAADQPEEQVEQRERAEEPIILEDRGIDDIEREAFTMAQEIRAHKANISMIDFLIKDDVMPLECHRVTEAFLVARVKEVEEAKLSLRKAMVHLKEFDTEYYEANLEARCNDYRQEMAKFFTASQARLLEMAAEKTNTPRNPTETALVESRKIKAQSLAKYYPLACTSLLDVTADIKALVVDDKMDQAEFRMFEEKEKTLSKKADEVKKDAQRLRTDAVDVGKSKEALDLEEKIRTLGKEQLRIQNEIQLGRADRNMLGTGSGSFSRGMDLTPPTFSGDPSSEYNFFRFSTDLKNYAAVRCPSKEELLRIILTKCLKGEALLACENMKTQDEIMTYLRGTFGNPRTLILQQLNEVRKLGNCGTGDDKMRLWAVAIKNKLEYGHKLAVEHEQQAELHHSNIAIEVQNRLPYRLQDEFLDILQKQNEGKELPREKVFTELVKFIQVIIDRCLYRMNLGIRLNEVEIIGSKPGNRGSDRPAKQGQATKRNYAVERADGGKNDRKDDRKNDRKDDRRDDRKDKRDKNKSSDDGNRPQRTSKRYSMNAVEVDCRLCNKGKHTHLFYCETFQQADTPDRYKLTWETSVCFRCLMMNSEPNYADRKSWFNQHRNSCDRAWVCKIDRCGEKDKPRQMQFLLCTYHFEANKDTEKEFLKSLQGKIAPSVKFFFNVPIFTNWVHKQGPGKDVPGWDILPDMIYPSIFALSNVIVGDEELLIFYDSGCQTASVSTRAAKLLNSENMREGPTNIAVASGKVLPIEGGDERFTLPLSDGKTRATITALCMDDVTSEFPVYDLQKAASDIDMEYRTFYPQGPALPATPDAIGGKQVDIMLGITYQRFFPQLVYMQGTGLSISQSQFMAPLGKGGVLAGPHSSWKHLRDSNHLVQRVYSLGPSPTLRIEHEPEGVGDEGVVELRGDVVGEVGVGIDRNIDNATDLACGYVHCDEHKGAVWEIPDHWDIVEPMYSTFAKDKVTRFLEGENMGSTIEYRCPSCRNCSSCKQGDVLESISLVEEHEQHLIEKSIRYDKDKKLLFAKLPFIANPVQKLTPNSHIAKKVFQTQLRKATADETVRLGVVASFKKLYDKGFVCKVADLPGDVRQKVEGVTGYVIPWRTVVKESSITTPVRMVFDASSRTPGGESLNNILAKGKNTLGNLFSILLRFRLKREGFSADVSMAYNGVKMEEEFVAFQQFFWKEEMREMNTLELWVVMTLIYGLRPAGQQTIEGFRQLAEVARAERPCIGPLGADILETKAYMDDILSAHETKAERDAAAQQLRYVLGLGSMSVKEITFSGQPPTEKVSTDGKHVGLLGMEWETEGDRIRVAVGDLYLGKKKRGETPEVITSDLKGKLSKQFTRRILVGKVAGVYDPLGLMVPITAKYKLNLHDICKLKLDWDDPVPPEYLDLWCRNIEEIQTLSGYYFSRSVVPSDAASTEINYVISCDASKEICISVVHSRILRKCGKYHVQVLAAKSKIVTDLTIPRAELKGAVMAATLGYCVRRDTGDQLGEVIHVTDSSIVLYWLTQDQRPLKTGVRNAALEIRRLTSMDSWFHVRSEDNIADTGTRSEVTADVSENSHWVNGKPWMSGNLSDMPLQTVQDITLNSKECAVAALELKAPDLQGVVMLNSLVEKVGLRHSYSKYIMDPARFSWPKSVRVLAVVFRFIDRSLKRGWSKPWFPELKEPEDLKDNWTPYSLERASNYFFMKASREVKQFGKKSDWEHCKQGEDKILYNTSRILEGQIVENRLGEGLDVEPLMFVRPVCERYSPVSYSVMTYSHSVKARHRNVAETVRESRKIAFVFGGRDLAIEIREKCPFCKRYRAQLLKRSMGKLHENRFIIAPPFYTTQIDIFGPMTAICEHSHRSTVKIWGLVFKDPTTGALSIHCMQKYNSAAFVLAYTRFASRFGHPNKAFIDAGSQLVKGVGEMQLSIIDAEAILSVQHQVGIKFEVVPVGCHNENGQVERSILEVRKLFSQMFSGTRLDILSYETAFQWVSNELNCFPQCLGTRTSNLDNLDVITPSRLIHGRDNRRCLSGPVRIDVPSKLIKQVDETTQAWFKVWANQRIQEYVPQPTKWQESGGSVGVGDIVVVLRKPADMAVGEPVWRIGRVVEVNSGRDLQSRSLTVEYRNSTEKVFRRTTVPTRQVAILHHENELELVDLLNEASKVATVNFILSKPVTLENDREKAEALHRHYQCKKSESEA